MDLLDFDLCQLPGDALPAAAAALLAQAAAGGAGADTALLRAQRLAPEHPAVLLARYRHDFARRRLDDALRTAERALAVSGRRLGLPADWRALDRSCVDFAAASAFGLLRFHLLALKATGVLHLRLGEVDAARLRLRKLAELDDHDRLGAARLLAAIDEFHLPLPPPAAAPTAAARRLA
ncbi:hypothetical protein [Azospira restricta]|uniref:Tetratricopeptide repeat protein n=1 Tax=Azospira restricta TaxID=404405 RepID=A0A974Y507_9RHOO|nr:hypothetical protein [Azospira restricta]QRJ64969.1 hypothetical protein IWH25_06410 [Azospira restricta]